MRVSERRPNLRAAFEQDLGGRVKSKGIEGWTFPVLVTMCHGMDFWEGQDAFGFQGIALHGGGCMPRGQGTKVCAKGGLPSLLCGMLGADLATPAYTIELEGDYPLLKYFFLSLYF